MLEAEFGEPFRWRLQKKPRQMQAAIAQAVNRLLRDPTDQRLHVQRVLSQPGVWEARIDYANRLTFEFPRDGVVLVLNHCNHDILDRP